MEIILTHSSWSIPILLGAGLYIWLIAKNPVLGAQTTLFLMPAYLVRVRIIPELPTNIFEIAAVLFVATMLMRLILRKEKLQQSSVLLAAGFILFLFGVFTSASGALLRAPIFETSFITIMGSLKGHVIIPVAFIVMLATMQRFKDARGRLLLAYIVSATAVAFLALLLGLLAMSPDNCFGVFFCDAVTYDLRLRGMYLSPNHLAMYILPAILLVGTSLLQNKWALMTLRRTYTLIIALILLVLALTLAKSAGAVLGAFAGILALWAYKKRDIHPALQKALPHLLGVLLVMGLLGVFIAAPFADRAWESGWRSPLASRLMIWQVSNQIVAEHAVLGVGSGSYQEAYLALQPEYPPYLEWAVPTPHNIGLATWLSAGLVGLSGLLLLLLAAGRRAEIKYIATSVALVALLVYGFVDTPLFKNDLTTLFLLLIVV